MINFREFGHPRKLFNNEYFPDYGTMKVFGYTINDFGTVILAYLVIIYIFKSYFSNSMNYILYK